MSDVATSTADIVNDVNDANETTNAIPNDKRLNELMKQVSKFGEEASLGRDSLPKLAHAIVKAASDGVLAVADAEAVYERYVAGEGKKAIHEHSTGGKKANVSKLRQLITMGAMTTIDAVVVMQSAFEARGRLVTAGEKVKSAYPFYVDVAREQQKADVALTDSQLEDLVRKDGPSEKTVEGVLTTILKRLEGLITGEGKDGLKDEDQLTIDAYDAVKARLDKMATLRQRKAVLDAAAKLGIALVA